MSPHFSFINYPYTQSICLVNPFVHKYRTLLLSNVFYNNCFSQKELWLLRCWSTGRQWPLCWPLQSSLPQCKILLDQQFRYPEVPSIKTIARCTHFALLYLLQACFWTGLNCAFCLPLKGELGSGRLSVVLMVAQYLRLVETKNQCPFNRL